MAPYIPSLTLPAFVFEQPAISILLPIALGTGVGFATSPRSTAQAFANLKEPPLSPPPYIFGPIWTALYASMGYAAHRAWTLGVHSFNPQTVALAKEGATLYTLQLGLNLIWMPLFFRLRRPIEATVDIVALTGVNIYLSTVWGQIDGLSANLLLPYILWLSFASYRTIGLGYLNNWTLTPSPKID